MIPFLRFSNTMLRRMRPNKDKMRTQSICLALAIVLICPFSSAQQVRTNGLNDQRLLHHPLMGTNDFQETPRGLLGHPTQHRGQADSLRASRMQSPLRDGESVPNGIQKVPRPLNHSSLSLIQQSFDAFTSRIRHDTSILSMQTPKGLLI